VGVWGNKDGKEASKRSGKSVMRRESLGLGGSCWVTLGLGSWVGAAEVGEKTKCYQTV